MADGAKLGAKRKKLSQSIQIDYYEVFFEYQQSWTYAQSCRFVLFESQMYKAIVLWHGVVVDDSYLEQVRGKSQCLLDFPRSQA